MIEHSLNIKESVMVLSREERAENLARLRKQQILEAALTIFSEKGFAAAKTAEIARSAGVSEGTIYNYFKNKRELFVAVIKNFIITVPLLDLIEKIPKDDVVLTFRKILENRFDLVKTDTITGLPSLMGEVQRDPELKSLWTRDFLQPFLYQLEKMYRTMSVSGKFRKMEPEVVVRVIGGLIIGFMILKIMEGEDSPLNDLSQEQITGDITEFILHGLLSSSGENTVSTGG